MSKLSRTYSALLGHVPRSIWDVLDNKSPFYSLQASSTSDTYNVYDSHAKFSALIVKT